MSMNGAEEALAAAALIGRRTPAIGMATGSNLIAGYHITAIDDVESHVFALGDAEFSLTHLLPFV